MKIKNLCLMANGIFVLLYHALVFSPALAQDTGRAEEIKTKCAGYRDIARFVQGKVVKNSVFESKVNGTISQAYTNEYKQNKDCVLMVEKRQSKDQVSEIAYVINSKYGFVLSRNPGKEWSIKELFLDNPVKASYNDQDLREHVINGLSLAYPTELGDRAFNITAVRRQMESGDELIALEFERSAKKDAPQGSTGTLVFRRNNSLSLFKVESITIYKSDVTSSKVELEYEGKLREFARLTKRTVRSSTPEVGAGARTSHSTSEFDLRYDENVPDTEFTLSAFGLPEPKGILWPQPSHRAWIWWGLGGLALIACAYAVFRWRTRNIVPNALA